MTETKRTRAKATATRAATTRKRRADPLVKAETERQVLALWVAGARSDEIERATKLSRATVYRIRRAALAVSIEGRDSEIVELRERELMTIDRLQRAHFQLAIEGSHRSAEIVLKCVGQRAKMLGLEAAIKVDATVKSELDAQIEQLVKELAENGVPIEMKGATA